MTKSEGSKDVDELVGKVPDWRGGTLSKLRKVVLGADPQVSEAVKWRRPSNPLGAAVWERDGIVCTGIVLKERVRIAFNHGASLPDPKGLFNAQLEGKSRAIDFREGDRIDDAALKALVRAGVKINATKKGARSPKAP